MRLNLSRSGVSTSVGVRGAHVTVGHGQIRETVGIPGTGISYTTMQGTQQEARSEAQPANVAEPLPKGRAWRGWLWIAAILGIAAVFAALSACMSSAESEARETVKSALKDPDSAQFRNIKFEDATSARNTCGEVNSKNSFGGYVGFQRFIVDKKGARIETRPGDPAFDAEWRFCEQLGR